MINYIDVISNVLNFWYFIPIILILMFFKMSMGKGILGEFFVNLAINI